MIFIVPCVWLVLAQLFMRWISFDRVASSLGLSLIRRVLHVHLPLLAMPIGAALFIGFAVRLRYLPTVLLAVDELVQLPLRQSAWQLMVAVVPQVWR